MYYTGEMFLAILGHSANGMDYHRPEKRSLRTCTSICELTNFIAYKSFRYWRLIKGSTKKKLEKMFEKYYALYSDGIARPVNVRR